jgi:hypothetical protein
VDGPDVWFRSQGSPCVAGSVYPAASCESSVRCDMKCDDPPKLTDAERAALEHAIALLEPRKQIGLCAEITAVLRGLLARSSTAAEV